MIDSAHVVQCREVSTRATLPEVSMPRLQALLLSPDRAASADGLKSLPKSQ
jgi:hypothetical protein